MRELPRERPPAGTIGDLPREARRIAELLRLGYGELALARLGAFSSRVAPGLSEAARRAGRAARMAEVLALLEAASLAQARGDLVALADVLEHELAPLLAD